MSDGSDGPGGSLKGVPVGAGDGGGGGEGDGKASGNGGGSGGTGGGGDTGGWGGGATVIDGKQNPIFSLSTLMS